MLPAGDQDEEELHPSRVNFTFTRYPLYRKLGGPHGRSGQVRKIPPPPGLDPRNAHTIVSRYTACAIRPTHGKECLILLLRNMQDVLRGIYHISG